MFIVDVEVDHCVNADVNVFVDAGVDALVLC